MRNRFLVVVTSVAFGFSERTHLVVTGFALPSPSFRSVRPTILTATTATTIDVAITNRDNNNTLSDITIPEQDTTTDISDLELNVIVSIQNVLSTAPNITQSPQQFFAALGDFGKASGALIGQEGLTPEALDEFILFWDDGYRALMRDLFRSYLFSREATRYGPRDWAALGWFLVLAVSSSVIFLPLLLPLIRPTLADVGEDGIDESAYVPPAFRYPRLAAMRRLRRPREPPLERYLASDTPRNFQEGISFFKEGTVLLARDVQRGTLTARNEDTWGSYAWFAFLSLSSFPITPVIIPLIDKRRNGQDDATSDYVPSSYRSARLRALARLRKIQAVKFGTSPVATLRAATNADPPPPEMLLAAILGAQQRRGGARDGAAFLEALAGVPGRRWELKYVAGQPAVVAMRKQLGRPTDERGSDGKGEAESKGTAGSGTWYRPLERVFLPWTRLGDGIYIDSDWVSAIQNFDAASMQNTNGVFQILKSDFFQTTVEGPFSWDGDCRPGAGAERGAPAGKRKRDASVCAFRPTRATFRLGPWWTIEQDIPEEVPFAHTHIRDLPFFKFIHVDEKVAVALGRSGGVALWTRMTEPPEIE